MRNKQHPDPPKAVTAAQLLSDLLRIDYVRTNAVAEGLTFERFCSLRASLAFDEFDSLPAPDFLAASGKTRFAAYTLGTADYLAELVKLGAFKPAQCVYKKRFPNVISLKKIQTGWNLSDTYLRKHCTIQPAFRCDNNSSKYFYIKDIEAIKKEHFVWRRDSTSPFRQYPSKEEAADMGIAFPDTQELVPVQRKWEQAYELLLKLRRKKMICDTFSLDDVAFFFKARGMGRKSLTGDYFRKMVKNGLLKVVSRDVYELLDTEENGGQQDRMD